ncbi:MAG TPA: hypothetical protein VG537_10780 [Candidatus Kapabacteria bacterium]|jgi:hypothetical protein|nr:hypothetical protein [Candidatus Kapabacteria bacterium]
MRSLSVFKFIPVLAFVFCLSFIGNGCAPSQQGTAYSTYTAPGWAPAYSDINTVPYYYFPDYGVYYDATAQQYYYPQNGAWASNREVPDRLRGVDLDHSYVVALDRNASKPWLNHSYYSQNYPPHHYDQYNNIVQQNRAIPNVAPNHEVVPRAYNENNDHVLFEERQRAAAGTAPGPRVATHEVPMQTISPNMPAQARQYRYGGGTRQR